MIRILIFCLVFSFSAWSKVTSSLHFVESNVSQGNLVRATLTMGADGIQKIQIQKLKGMTLGETVYFYDVSPFVKKGDSFEAEAKVIFVKVPESKTILHKLPQEELQVDFPGVTITPTEAPPTFVYENFSIPGRPQFFLWLSIIAILLLGAFYGPRFYTRMKNKKLLKEKRLNLKNKLLNASDYDSIVTVWKNRTDYMKEFSHIEEPFRKFEGVLFKYQFKPTQSEVEKKIVIEAYEKFRSDITGGFHGI